MTIIFAAMQYSLLILESTIDGWTVKEHLKQHNVNSIAIDHYNKNRVYCGTFDHGLWKTDDNGQTWEKTPLNITVSYIMSLSVSKVEKGGESGFGRLCVGTEPSFIFTSIDGGITWEKIDEFNNLPSSSTWSFPPRPDTHHVRWIEPDAKNENNIYAAIEAGALIKSIDGGKSWIDRVRDGPYDTHTLRTHKMAPGKLCSAAGDGYFESQDYGNSWKRLDNGLGEHTYLTSIAINSNDPQNKVVSAASNPWTAHSRDNPESFLYRCSANNEDNWELVTTGIPESKGTITSILESHPNKKDEFYCLNNQGIFSSRDAGFSWEKLEIPWSKENYIQHPWGLAIRG